MIFKLSIKLFIIETFNIYKKYKNDNNNNNKK